MLGFKFLIWNDMCKSVSGGMPRAKSLILIVVLVRDQEAVVPRRVRLHGALE